MSRIHDALEKAKQERAQPPVEGLMPENSLEGIAGQAFDSESRERIRVELEKQGLVYNISPDIVAYHYPKSTVSEEYRIVRTNFLSMAQKSSPKNPIKSIVVSSSNHKEGKSVTATNLAFALAQDGQRRVLLVDCDLRKPSVRKLLGVRPKHDIIDVLTKDIPLNNAIIPTPFPSLHVIVVNGIPANPASLSLA